MTDQDKPAMGETPDGKSIFCEHIGVTPGQPFIVHDYPYRDYPPMVYGEDGCVRLYSPDGQKRHKVGGRAITWIMDHPESVEPCRGYTPQDAAFKKEETMDKQDNPRICEVLGGKDHPLEVGEPFDFGGDTYIVLETCGGEFLLYYFGRNAVPGSEVLASMIAHTDRIIRKPRFSEEEVAFMRTFYAAATNAVFVREENGQLYLVDSKEYEIKSLLPIALLPSLRPGQAVALSEIVEAEQRPSQTCTTSCVACGT